MSPLAEVRLTGEYATGPASVAAVVEREPRIPLGWDERFAGYGMMGVVFESGHVLALRRFPASSIGVGYTTVWHHGPEGEWTFYSDTAPRSSCARFFGSALIDAVIDTITIDWPSSHELVVSAERARLDWRMMLGQTPGTRLANRIARSLPDRAWRDHRTVDVLGRAAGRFLGAGELRLTGEMPNGQRYLLMPKQVWSVVSSRASIGGAELGRVRLATRQPRLGDFVIPRRPLFAFGESFVERFDPTRHLASVSRLAG